MIKAFQNKTPHLGQNVFLSDTAAVIGDVTLGDDVSIWFGSVIRGDMHYIKVGSRSNIQDNAVVHVTAAVSPTYIGSGVTIGHGAIIHGCTIEDNCMIGMGATVMDNAVIGTGSLIGAGALVPPNMVVPSKSLVVGMPGKVCRKVREEEYDMILKRPQEYIDLAAIHSSETL